MIDTLVRDKSTGCAIIAPKGELDYFSDESQVISTEMTAIETYLKMTSNLPAWLNMAFKVRDKLSRIAGVEEIHGFSSNSENIDIQQGAKLDFFDVVQVSKNELILASVDRHLRVLLSIQTITELNNTNVRVTASVKVNNWFGYLYMIPVKPAHKLIVRYMLNRLN